MPSDIAIEIKHYNRLRDCLCYYNHGSHIDSEIKTHNSYEERGSFFSNEPTCIRTAYLPILIEWHHLCKLLH